MLRYVVIAMWEGSQTWKHDSCLASSNVCCWNNIARHLRQTDSYITFHWRL